MPKVVLSAKKRGLQFQNSSLESKNGKLWCTCCNEELDFSKKSVIDSHLRSSKHRRNSESLTTALTKEPQIKEVIGKEPRWQAMVESFVSAGVPLNVFHNTAVRNWMTKKVQAGETFPGATSLRRSLQLSGEKNKNESILYLRDKQIAIVADESVDIKNRKILNILAKPLEPGCKFRLISSKVILQCNAIEVATQVDSALNEHYVKKNNVNEFIFCFYVTECSVTRATSRI